MERWILTIGKGRNCMVANADHLNGKVCRGAKIKDCLLHAGAFD